MEEFEHLDYYALLGIERNARIDAIKKAYRQQMILYHPDRYIHTNADEQAYASRRAQRINEAYQVLSDFVARTAYNRRLAPENAEPEVASLKRASAAPPAPPPRDTLADLYDKARDHLDAGRYPQAIADFRTIQQINPFYRDSAVLLAQAEAALRRATRATSKARPTPKPDKSRRKLVFGGVGALAMAGLGALGWGLRDRLSDNAAAEAPQADPLPSPTTPPASPAPTVPPAPTPASTVPTAPVSPDATARTAPVPTSDPTAPPVAATPVTLPETGPIAYANDLTSGEGWPEVGGRGWNVGFAQDGYRITAVRSAGNIWAFNTSPAGMDYLIGVDVTVTGGAGGLMVRFAESNFLAFFVEPATGRYRLEQRVNGSDNRLRDEVHPAIATEPQATNRLVARLAGLEVALGINGQAVATLIVEAPPPTSRYGMIALAREPEVVALFRNLSIREL
ncbi:J domain-containing protein [Candidatus Chloroploca sp. M-50]|uniref:J domain-containing protein n=1 Tax=Candidatus Chloroploca mongolica TaxID=2528176 RepID=A0ABS4D6P8_9CHLR|nr:J domain-containing protein [Candidatus Chloroploca mongolica]MBP1465118.1 J domain-containing protein [Candidatus Chloroploca mongolica]